MNGERAPVLPERVVDRYALYGEIAAGGMATVYLGRLIGPVGFARTVAVKCLHPGYAKDPEFVSMFLDEARLAARVRHPNVVSTIDVVVRKGELFLVMEYVAGESLAKLARVASSAKQRIPLSVGTSIVVAALHGLHAAHEALSDRGEPLGLVHRDVSPQNVLVGSDGVARVIDFGVAKAQGRVQTTREGQVKGKIAYMAPEQLLGDATRRSDVYAAGLVLWELVAGRRAFTADSEPALMARVLHARLEPPSAHVDTAMLAPAEAASLRALDAIVMRAVDREPEARFATAQEMALAIEAVLPPLPARDIGAWVTSVGGEALAARLRAVAEVESASAMVAVDRVTRSDAPPPMPALDRISTASVTSAGGPVSVRTEASVSRELATEVEGARPRPRGLRWLLTSSIALVATLALVAVFAGGARAPTPSPQASAPLPDEPATAKMSTSPAPSFVPSAAVTALAAQPSVVSAPDAGPAAPPPTTGHKPKSTAPVPAPSAARNPAFL